MREPIDADPERAARARATHRVVDAFLMRTADDAIGGDGVLDVVLADECRDTAATVGSCRTSVPFVTHVFIANDSCWPGRSITAATSFVASRLSGP